MYLNIWHVLPCNYGLDAAKPGVLQDFQNSDGKDKEAPLNTSEFVTEKASNPYCGIFPVLLASWDPSTHTVEMDS